MKSVNLRTVKRRIGFLNNFQKITQTISLISFIEHQKSHTQIRKIVNNVYHLLSLFSEISKRHPETQRILQRKFQIDESGKKLVIVIASDKGLAGALDQNIFQKTENYLKQKKDFYLGTIGLKAEKYFEAKYSLIFKSSNFEKFSKNDFIKLLNSINLLFTKKEINKITVIRPNLINFNFMVDVIQIFPFNIEVLNQLIEKHLLSHQKIIKFEKPSAKPIWEFNYILEPKPEILINTIINQTFYLILYALILQSLATLEFVRTTTMKRASDNAQNLKEKEILIFNKLRQQKITAELIDISRE